MSTILTPSRESGPTQAVADDALYEVVNGVRVELPPMGAYSTWITAIFDQILGPHARAYGLGRVVGEMLFLIDRDKNLQRRPDVAFVSYARWPRNVKVPRDAAWDVVPELAIEVVSPTNTAVEILEKLKDYFRTGVQLVWVVYENTEQVYVYHSIGDIAVFGIGQELDGESLLPGLRVPVETLFRDEVGAP